jgi:outer membrane biosynthesis protein TonB
MPTTAAGRFVMADLLPGPYQLTVSYDGFRTFRAPAVEVIGPDTEVRVQLQVGSVSEAVRVRPGGAPAAPTTGVATALSTPADDSGPLGLARPEMPDAVTVIPPASQESSQLSPDGTSSPRPVRIGGAVKPPRKISDVAPQFPAEAVGMAGTRGVVLIEATIGQDGAVRDARIVRREANVTFGRTDPAQVRDTGHSAAQLQAVLVGFDAAALAAVSQWRYSPALLNGKPTDVTMTATISFVQ